MYNLEKFCRICVQTGVKLTDIDTTDSDSLKYSEKLKACTQIVINRERLSTKICSSCIHKLRISYQFQLMCKKSTTILQQYLRQFIHLQGTKTTKTKPRRKRIGKDQRCSLLKKLLSKISNEQTVVHNSHISSLTELCNKLQPIPQEPKIPLQPCNLEHLIKFTKNYDFGYNTTSTSNNFDLTPIDCLTKFTDSFFYDHFGDYRDVILHVRDNLDSESSEDELFQQCEPEPLEVKQEIVIIEPDLSFKKELYYDEDDDLSSELPANYVQTCYDDHEVIVKEECIDLDEIPESVPEDPLLMRQDLDEGYLEDLQMYKVRKCRTLSPYSVKCRTRGNPFINPTLKTQFQNRNFKCNSCSRRFKSPGYLKAHCSKLKH